MSDDEYMKASIFIHPYVTQKLVIQCVDRKLKAADQLIYAEDDDILHVAFIATNVNRCENYLNHQYTLSEPFKIKNFRLFSTVLYFTALFYTEY